MEYIGVIRLYEAKADQSYRKWNHKKILGKIIQKNITGTTEHLPTGSRIR